MLDFDAARPSPSRLGKSKVWGGRQGSTTTVMAVMLDAALGHTTGVMAVMLNAILGVVGRPRRLARVEVASYPVGRPEPVLGALSEAGPTPPSARVLLGSLEKRLAETLVQAGAGGVILVNAAVIHERRVAA